MQSVHPTLRFCNLSRRNPTFDTNNIRLRHIATDLAQPAEIRRAVAEVLAWLKSDPPTGKVLLINNSGFGGYGRFPDPELGHQLEMIDLNVRALVELTGHLMPTLRQHGGAIINVASTAAFQPTPWMAVYGATKAFVLHWSLALNQELKGTGVRALAVCPGPTATEFFKRAGLQQGSVSDHLSMSSDAVVLASLEALVAGRTQVVTGWKNWLGAVLITKLPKPMAAWMAAKALAHFRFKKVVR